MQLRLKLQLGPDGRMVHYEIESVNGLLGGVHPAEPNLNIRLGELVNNHLQTMCNQVLSEAKRLRKKGQ